MSHRQMHQWLWTEIAQWVRDGLITDTQAGSLRARYPVAASGTAWGMIVFSTIGAVIAGLGVILLFAYNWDAIPKFGKLAIVFGALAAVHGSGLRLYFAGGRFRNLGEGLCLLGTMLFGAGIWLVAQIYHIDEHFPNAFLIWALGALVMALAMPSTPQALLATVLLCVWCGAEQFRFDTTTYAAPLLLGVVLGGLAWQRKSLLLLGAVVPAFTFTVILTLPHLDRHPWLIFSAILNLGALWIALRFLVRSYGDFPKSGRIFGFYGWVIFYASLFLLCFPELSHHLLHIETDMTPGVRTAWLVLFALAAAAWILVFVERVVMDKNKEPTEPGFEIFLAPLTILLVLCGVLWPATFHDWFLSGPCNLVFLGLAVSMMSRGCRQSLPGPAIIGSLLLIALAIARYFDLFESLLVRGLIFIAIGAIVFAEGYLYARAKKAKTGGEAES